MCRSPRSRWGRAPRCWRVGWICRCWRFTGRVTSRARAMRWSRIDPSLVELVQVLLCPGEFGLVEDRDPVLEQQLRGHPGAGVLGAGESTVVVLVQAAGGTGLLEDGHPHPACVCGVQSGPGTCDEVMGDIVPVRGEDAGPAGQDLGGVGPGFDLGRGAGHGQAPGDLGAVHHQAFLGTPTVQEVVVDGFGSPVEAHLASHQTGADQHLVHGLLPASPFADTRFPRYRRPALSASPWSGTNTFDVVLLPWSWMYCRLWCAAAPYRPKSDDTTVHRCPGVQGHYSRTPPKTITISNQLVTYGVGGCSTEGET